MRTRLPKRPRLRPIRPERRGGSNTPPSTDPANFFGTSTPPNAPSQTPPASPRRRRWQIAAVIVAVGVVLGAAAAVYLTRPTITLDEPSLLTSDGSPTVRASIERPLWLNADDVTVEVDGNRVDDAEVRVESDGFRSTGVVTAQLPELRDGEHTVVVSAGGVGLLQQSLDTKRTVTVDTTPPKGAFVAPKPTKPNAYIERGVVAITKLPVTVTANVEDGSTVEIDSTDASMDPVLDDGTSGGLRSVQATLPQGSQTLLVRVRDEAGNVTTLRRPAVVDTVGPKLTFAMPRVVRSATLDTAVRGADPHGVTLQAKIDGKVVEDSIEQTAATEAPNAGDTAAGGGDEDDDVPPIAATWKVTVDEPLYEGRHTVELIAKDSIGAVTRETRTIIVDSTESSAKASGLRAGARGNDVVELQRGLISRKAATQPQLAGEMTSKTYGPATKRAVQTFQSKNGLGADGVAGSDTLATLTLKIVVNRASHTLTLFRSGAMVKSWGVAVGSPQYPTPAGSFKIQSMQENPTWTPPDSDWAKDAEVIPPGPDNPLGTRWMAIDGTVGIHGTNSPASIGYSVSHGCIRMAIADVEELYELVRIGTPVDVV